MAQDDLTIEMARTMREAQDCVERRIADQCKGECFHDEQEGETCP